MVSAKCSSQQLARAMAGRDLDRTFAPRKLLPNATSSSSSGTQCRGGADSARQALCGCRSTSLHMLTARLCCKNAEQRNGDRFRECARQLSHRSPREPEICSGKESEAMRATRKEEGRGVRAKACGARAVGCSSIMCRQPVARVQRTTPRRKPVGDFYLPKTGRRGRTVH